MDIWSHLCLRDVNEWLTEQRHSPHTDIWSHLCILESMNDQINIPLLTEILSYLCLLKVQEWLAKQGHSLPTDTWSHLCFSRGSWTPYYTTTSSSDGQLVSYLWMAYQINNLTLGLISVFQRSTNDFPNKVTNPDGHLASSVFLRSMNDLANKDTHPWRTPGLISAFQKFMNDQI